MGPINVRNAVTDRERSTLQRAVDFYPQYVDSLGIQKLLLLQRLLDPDFQSRLYERVAHLLMNKRAPRYAVFRYSSGLLHGDVLTTIFENNIAKWPFARSTLAKVNIRYVTDFGRTNFQLCGRCAGGYRRARVSNVQRRLYEMERACLLRGGDFSAPPGARRDDAAAWRTLPVRG